MSDGDALLAAILASPKDDSARLVYADWLQENGQELWGEFIRIQVELAQPAPERPASMKIDLLSSPEHVQRVEECRECDARRPELERRERELLAAVHDTISLPEGWSVGTGLGLTVRARRGDVFLRRGFVEHVVCSANVWVTDAELLLAKHPVERVRLTARPFYGEYGSRSHPDKPDEYLFALGYPLDRGIPAHEDPFSVWTHRQLSDPQTGRVARLLLEKRWPGIHFELPR